ncbi:J domain-containing protein [Peptacetobacter sp. AB845]|uniref:J domain-containing protein n=1 Tax=Peptacetobacter sp. AB845 TaxID=3388429 RepID=UPI0039C96BB7
MIESIWDILGIEPTSDRKKIKKAYAEKTKIYHPEDYPEEFKIVQEAYQWAMKYASKSVVNNSIESEKVEHLFDNNVEITSKDIEQNYSTVENISTKSQNEKTQIEVDYSDLEEENLEFKNKKIEEVEKIEEKNSDSKTFTGGEIFNELYDERTRDDEIDQMNYFLNYIEKKIPKKINMEMFRLILSNSYVKSYLEQPDFKIRFEEIMVNKSYADTLYTEKKMSEIARKYNLYKVARAIDKATKQRYILGMRTPVFILGVLVVISGLFLKIESKKAEKAEQISKTISQSIEKSGETVHKIRESMLNTSLIINRDFINGYDVKVEKDNGYYIILNSDEKPVIDKVNKIEFTMSNLILLNKSGVYSILDTKNGNIVNTDYKDLKVADIIEDGEKRYGILGMDQNKNWYIVDDKGNSIKKVSGEETIGKLKVELKDGKASFTNEE